MLGANVRFQFTRIAMTSSSWVTMLGANVRFQNRGFQMRVLIYVLILHDSSQIPIVYECQRRTSYNFSKNQK